MKKRGNRRSRLDERTEALIETFITEHYETLKQQSKKRLDSMDYSFVLASNVLPEADPQNLRMEAGCAQLAQQYFRAEAPARIKDFAWWAGINVTDAIRAAGEIKPKLVPIFVEGSPDEFLMSESEVDEFFAFEPPEFAIGFIPYRDTYLKGQREIVNRFAAALVAAPKPIGPCLTDEMTRRGLPR